MTLFLNYILGLERLPPCLFPFYAHVAARKRVVGCIVGMAGWPILRVGRNCTRLSWTIRYGTALLASLKRKKCRTTLAMRSESSLTCTLEQIRFRRVGFLANTSVSSTRPRHLAASHCGTPRPAAVGRLHSSCAGFLVIMTSERERWARTEEPECSPAIFFFFSPVEFHCNCSSCNRFPVCDTSSTRPLTSHRKDETVTPTDKLAPESTRREHFHINAFFKPGLSFNV